MNHRVFTRMNTSHAIMIAGAVACLATIPAVACFPETNNPQPTGGAGGARSSSMSSDSSGSTSNSTSSGSGGSTGSTSSGPGGGASSSSGGGSDAGGCDGGAGMCGDYHVLSCAALTNGPDCQTTCDSGPGFSPDAGVACGADLALGYCVPGVAAIPGISPAICNGTWMRCPNLQPVSCQ